MFEGDEREKIETSKITTEDVSVYVMDGNYQNLEADISATLSRMGISASIKGYHFIRRAIMMAVDNEEAIPVLIEHGRTKFLKITVGDLNKEIGTIIDPEVKDKLLKCIFDNYSDNLSLSIKHEKKKKK